MKKYEYKVFNMSEAAQRNERATRDEDKKWTWLAILNEHGAQGWKVQDRITKASYLMIRETPVSELKLQKPI